MIMILLLIGVIIFVGWRMMEFVFVVVCGFSFVGGLGVGGEVVGLLIILG